MTNRERMRELGRRGGGKNSEAQRKALERNRILGWIKRWPYSPKREEWERRLEEQNEPKTGPDFPV